MSEADYDEEENRSIIERPRVSSTSRALRQTRRRSIYSSFRRESVNQQESLGFFKKVLGCQAIVLQNFHTNIFDNRYVYFFLVILLLVVFFSLDFISIEEMIVGVITSTFLLLLIRVSPPETIIIEEESALIETLRRHTRRRWRQRSEVQHQEGFENNLEMGQRDRLTSPSTIQPAQPESDQNSDYEPSNDDWDFDFMRTSEINEPMENRRERRRDQFANNQEPLIDILRRVHYLASQLRPGDLSRTQEPEGSPFGLISVPFFSWYDFQQWIEIQEAQMGGPRRAEPESKKGLSDKEIEEIQDIRFGEISNVFGLMTCSICLELFTEDSQCKVLSCQHAFHSNCVAAWLKMSAECPNCKLPHKVVV
jgi:Ring finger domain